MELKKIDIVKINRKDGFDTFDLLRNGGDLDEQKVSAVIKTMVDTINTLIDTQENLMGIVLKMQREQKSQKPARKTKGGAK